MFGIIFSRGGVVGGLKGSQRMTVSVVLGVLYWGGGGAECFHQIKLMLK